jgi:hypothetical protein
MSKSFIDPKTGEPGTGEGDNSDGQTGGTPEQVTISKEDWQALQTRLDVYERQASYQRPREDRMQKPAVPQGPSFETQVQELEAKIDGLDDKIDDATQNGKPVKAFLREQRKLQAQLTQMQIYHNTVEPLERRGVQTLNYLSKEVTRKGMPYYDLVRDDMDKFLNQVPEDQRSDPQVLKFAYQSCVGAPDVLNKIMAQEKEKILREASNNNAPDLNGSGRQSSKEKKAPSPGKILGPEAMRALREKGVTVDKHYRSFGYEGWEDYWQKKGKIHFQDHVTEE